MVASSLFKDCPQFPTDVNVAELPEISLLKLTSEDDKEALALVEASRNLGFFLLSLQGDSVGEDMISELTELFERTIPDVMNADKTTQEEYSQHLPELIWGYKLEGKMDNGSGKPDRCTFYQMPRDDLLGNIPQIKSPDAIRVSRPLMTSYLKHGRQVLELILRALEVPFDLPKGTFHMLMPPDQCSGTITRLIRYSSSPNEESMRTGLLPHTDFGTVTLLANVLGGLQILKPGEDPKDDTAWQWVKPRPGCIIVNMGDAMVEWTGGVLRSNMHRVNYAPGQQRHVERNLLAILFRPRADATMDRLVGGRIPSIEEDKAAGIDTSGVGSQGTTAAEWHIRKGMMLHQGKDIAQSRGGREPGPIAIAGQ